MAVSREENGHFDIMAPPDTFISEHIKDHKRNHISCRSQHKQRFLGITANNKRPHITS